MPLQGLIISQDTDTARTTRAALWPGERGSVEALLLMRRAIRRNLGLDGGTFNRRLYDVASNVLYGYDVPAHDAEAAAEAIHDFVINNVRWIQDPAGGNEFLESADLVLDRGYADCDGLVVLECALYGMVGFSDVQLEAAAYEETANGGLQHVYDILTVNGEPVYSDPTANDKPLGWHEETPLKWVRVSIFDESPRIEGLLATIIAAGTTIATSVLGHKGAGKADREAGAQFEQAAAQVTHIFDSIDAKGRANITVEDYNAALQAYNALAQLASANIPYITAKWQSDDYAPAYERRLASIQAAAIENDRGAGGGSPSGGGGLLTGGGASGGFDIQTLVIAAGVGLVAAKVLGR